MSGSTLFENMKIRFTSLAKEEIYAKILCGEVLVNGQKERNPKIIIENTSIISVLEKKYVSRGGIKLEKALTQWNISCKDKIFLDAGSSTGGFTDCLLHHGAAGVHSVDVGYNQLAYRLRQDPRVFVHEKTNIMDAKVLEPFPDAGVADLSFRSIHGAAAKILSLVKERWLIALVKPQFEIDKAEYPNFNGIISDPAVLLPTMITVINRMTEEGVYVSDTALSPIRGRKGNIEFLFLLKDTEDKPKQIIEKQVETLINSLKGTS